MQNNKIPQAPDGLSTRAILSISLGFGQDRSLDPGLGETMGFLLQEIIGYGVLPIAAVGNDGAVSVFKLTTKDVQGLRVLYVRFRPLNVMGIDVRDF